MNLQYLKAEHDYENFDCDDDIQQSKQVDELDIEIQQEEMLNEEEK